MKLKNKKTGEIVDTLSEKNTAGITIGIDHHDGDPTIEYYNSLAELCEEWSDYEEPKEFWYISCEGKINRVPYSEHCYYQEKEIGNYFSSKEEAEKTVEKLKAWKQLKDKGFKFGGIDGDYIRFSIDISKVNSTKEKEELNKYGKLLFGGEG